MSESFEMSIRILGRGFSNLNSEKNPSCLGYIGDYTTQLYGH